MRSYKLYINGKFVDASSNQTFFSKNPANPKDILGVFQKASALDVDHAVHAAEKAFLSWSALPAPKRGAILLNVAALLRREKQTLGKLVTREMGKQFLEGLADVQEAIDVAEYMGGEGRRFFGYTTPSELPHKFCMTLRRPLGVVGLITPWNFPIAIPAWKIMAALICGNTCVLKPSSVTPLCAFTFVQLLEKAGVPKGVVNVVTGDGNVVGHALVTHPKVRAISFTGSKMTGEEILKHAGVKKIGLELGGKNAIIIMDDADLALAVEGVLWGAFGTTGQRCTAASRVIVHEKIQKQFETLLLKHITSLKPGDGMKCNFGPLVNEAALQKTESYVALGKKEGAKIIYGGKKVTRLNGYFFEPTLFTNVAPMMRIAQEEIFGPVLSILTCKNLSHAVQIANNVEYGLSSALYTKDIRNAFLAIEHLDTGITYINSSTIGAEVHLPFGGVKGTGNGTREAGILGIDEFSEIKTVYIDYSGRLQKAQIDEFVEK
ncbi:MAG: aldehyde dehydrogenase family protein [Nanoarchaeota archaeon]